MKRIALKKLVLVSVALVGAVAVGGLGGCATSPEYIAPLAVSESGYMSLSCDELAQKQAELGKELSEAADAQRANLNGDTFGMVLVGLPLWSYFGTDVTDKVARLKGEIQALQAAAESKNCHLTPIDVQPHRTPTYSDSGF